MTETLHDDPAAQAADRAAAALLGCMLRAPAGAALKLSADLHADDLDDPRHRAVLTAVRGLAERGVDPDPVLVEPELRRSPDGTRMLADTNAAVFLFELVSGAPTLASARHYLDLVLEHAERRRARETAARLRHAADLPDVEEFRYAVSNLRTQLTASSTRSSSALHGVDLGRIAKPPEPQRWLVEGRLTERSLVLLGAKPGVGKSWLAVDLAIALTLGRPWLGCTIPTVRRVLYLDAENGEELALRRMRQLGLHPDLAAGRLLYSTDPLILDRPDDLNRYSATLAAHQPDLVIVDTLASHAPAAEADTESSSRFLAEVWGRARAAGSGLLLLHHLRKSLQGSGKDDPLDAFRGAGHLVGAASRAWVLRPLAGDGARFLLVDAKAREFTAHDPIRVAVVDEHNRPADDPRTTVVVEGVERTQTLREAFLDDVLAHLAAAGGRPASTANLVHIGLAIGASERSCKGWLAEALAAGVVARAGRGAYTAAQDALPDPIEPDDDQPEDAA